MHETPEDLDRLQRLLDDSYAVAGEHLVEVITTERRLDAPALDIYTPRDGPEWENLLDAGWRPLTFTLSDGQGKSRRPLSRTWA